MSIKMWIASFKREQAEKDLDKLKADYRSVIYERDGAVTEKRKVVEELEGLKLKKKIEEEDIKHMVKIKEEKLEIEHQKKVIELERKKESEVSAVKDGYRDKVEKNLERQLTDMQKMYVEILQRLPNVNVQLGNKVK